MKTIKEKLIENIGILAGILTALLFYVWYGTLTKYLSGDIGILPCVLMTFVTAVGYIICFYDTFANKKDYVMQRQLIKLNGFVSCFCALYFIAVLRENDYRKHGIFVLSVLLFLIATIGMAIWCRPRMTADTCEWDIKSWGKEHIGLCILLITCAVLSIEETGLCYRWDSGLYYITVADTNLFSLSSMATYGHIAQAFGMLTSLGTAVTGSVDVGIFVMNVCVLLAGVAAFYGIMVTLVPGKKQIVYTLATAVYAFSPFTLGMVNYINLDFYMQCLFPIVIYYMVKKEWILHFMAALFFCFTKEPAIITYGCMCIGMVLYDICKNRSLKRVFIQKRYYLMVLCGIIWVLTYFMLGPWSAGDGGVGFSIDYIVRKLSVLYIMNFNWILTILMIALVIWIMFRKDKRDWIEQLLPVFFALIGFTLFSCLFATANHARYIDISFVVICMMGMLFLLSVGKRPVQLATMVSLVVLMLVSVYNTVDPVTVNFFKKVNVGEKELVSTSTNGVIADQAIYNRQMLYLEKPFAYAVAEAIEQNASILLPSMKNNTWYLNGMDQFHTIEDYRMADVLWDTGKQKRVFFENKDTVETSFCEMAEETDMYWMTEKFPEEQVFSYIYMDSIGAERIAGIDRYFDIVEQKEYSYRGFVVKQIIFERK